MMRQTNSPRQRSIGVIDEERDAPPAGSRPSSPPAARRSRSRACSTGIFSMASERRAPTRRPCRCRTAGAARAASPVGSRTRRGTRRRSRSSTSTMQRRPPADPVGPEAEERRADRPHEQRQRGQERHLVSECRSPWRSRRSTKTRGSSRRRPSSSRGRRRRTRCAGRRSVEPLRSGRGHGHDASSQPMPALYLATRPPCVPDAGRSADVTLAPRVFAISMTSRARRRHPRGVPDTSPRSSRTWADDGGRPDQGV